MTHFSRLGKELRHELGEPPPGWVERQRLRLRGLELGRPRSKRRVVLQAAFVVGAVVLVGFFLKPGAEGGGRRASLDEAEPRERAVSLPQEAVKGAESWVEARAEVVTHALEDGSSLELQPGARGRLDQHEAKGARFDLHAGRATFEIQKQKGPPFSVVAGEYRVVVVGTRFSTVYAPPSELIVEVYEGAVQVYLPGRAEPVGVAQSEVLEVQGQKFSLRKGEAARSNAKAAEKSPSPPLVGAASWKELSRAGKYREACASARERSLVRLRGELGASGLSELAGTLRLCGDTEEALSTFAALKRRFPASSAAQDSTFLIGRILAAQGQMSQATVQFERYLSEVSNGRFAAEALGRLIELHEKRGNRDKAASYAHRYLKLAPQGPYRRLAESMVEGP